MSVVTRLWLSAAIGAVVASCMAPPQPQPTSAAPDTVGGAKLNATAYHDSGDYIRDFGRAAQPVNDWLRERAPKVSRPALVLDVDETALSNWPVIVANDYGRFAAGPCLLPQGPCGWHAWDLLGRGTALDPTLEVYKTARSLNVAVFFISGRPESEREVTERNLHAVGYTDYVRAYFTPDDAHYASLADFKRPTRGQIASEGYAIIANVGDQESDLDGGFAERAFLMPNPFYYVP